MYPVAQKLHPRKKKVYVAVTSKIDTTGYMHPKSVEWGDGRMFEIEEVRDFRPARTVGTTHTGDCYTVVIRGEQRRLFFEQASDSPQFGRWFVEVQYAG